MKERVPDRLNNIVGGSEVMDPSRESFLNDIELNGFFRDLNSYLFSTFLN